MTARGWRPGSLRNTKAALKVYDEGEARREALYNAITTRKRTAAGAMRAFEKWNRAVQDNIRRVQRAFWNDTSDRNSLENCWLLCISTLREWCARCPD